MFLLVVLVLNLAKGPAAAVALLVLGGVLLVASFAVQLRAELAEPRSIRLAEDGVLVSWRDRSMLFPKDALQLRSQPVVTKFGARAYEFSGPDTRFRVFATIRDLDSLLTAFRGDSSQGTGKPAGAR